MAHGRDKPGREKRKQKKVKSLATKSPRESDVLVHVQQHGQNTEQRD